MIRFRQAVDLGGGQVRHVADPTAADDAATKAYADNILGGVSALNPLPVSFAAGWTPHSIPSLTATPATVKAAAGLLGGYMLYNGATAVTYILVYDKASGVTVGTTTPDYLLAIPAGSAANLELTCGVTHANGIIVAASADTLGAQPASAAVTGTFFIR